MNKNKAWQTILDIGYKPKKHIGYRPNHTDDSIAKMVPHDRVWQDKNGNIHFGYVNLHRSFIISDPGKSTKVKDMEIVRKIRKADVIDGDGRYYQIPKGYGVFCWLTERVLDCYKSKSKIKTLVITEGEKKAIAGDHLLDIHIVAIPGIYQLGGKGIDKFFDEIDDIIKVCQVDNLVLLLDADAKDIKWKEGKDLSQRPMDFFKCVSKFRQYAKDKCDCYFAHINSDSEYKGLDDLAIVLKPAQRKRLKKEITQTGVENKYIRKIDVGSILPNKILEEFHVLEGRNKAPKHFYQKYETEIGYKEFKYKGAIYIYDEDAGDLKRIKSEAAAPFINVGGNYYQKSISRLANRDANEDKQWTDILEYNLDRITSGGLRAALGNDPAIFKSVSKDIPFYNRFTLMPGHCSRFRQEYTVTDDITGLTTRSYNSYRAITHTPREGEIEHIMKLMQHIFGTHEITHTDKWANTKTFKAYELGFDYLQILYRYPRSPLPLLFLISPEQATGKTTFWDMVRDIFQQNVIEMDIARVKGQFTSLFVDKLLVIFDEVKSADAQVGENLKKYSTAKKSVKESKGVDGSEIETFTKFGGSSNREDFLLIDDEDTRYWVLPIKSIPKSERKLDMQDRIREEIPALLYLLEKRELVTQKETRVWFARSLTETAALKKTQQLTRRGIEVVFYETIRDLHFLTGKLVLKYTPKDIKQMYDTSEGVTEAKVKSVCTKKWNTPRKQYSTYPYDKYSYNQSQDTVDIKPSKGSYYTFIIDKFAERDDWIRIFSEIHSSDKEKDDNTVTFINELIEYEQELIKLEKPTWFNESSFRLLSQLPILSRKFMTIPSKEGKEILVKEMVKQVAIDKMTFEDFIDHHNIKDCHKFGQAAMF